ncbi:MAG TPA: VWA domain-containing protein [Acidimicrobiales bacterium]|jgi:Ca-activated chloride channel family protein|nr:VWA domain-containing protein [Acidimicrobiales bacterium]
MTLIAPSRLWLLLAVAGLVVAYAVAQRRRTAPAVRHPDLALIDSFAPRFGGWRRHLTALALVLALTALVVGLARPAHAVEVERKEAVVVLALDVSKSMTATDVAPTRLAAAQKAAKEFVESAPDGYRIGLVTFDAKTHTLASPTTDRAELLAAIDSLQAANGTAAGDGLKTAVDVLEADATAKDASADDTYRAVILLADGDSSTGTTLDQAADGAVEAKIPVFTIAYGTDDATIVVDGKTMDAGADPEAIAAVADKTGGTDYSASTSEELSSVYDQIGTTIGTAVEHQELTVPLSLLAAALLSLAVIATTAWTPRLT